MSAARRLRIAPEPGEVLRAEISDICAQIDRRLGSPPRTAERAIWFWYWPPDSTTTTAVLTRLHADAVGTLHLITAAGPQYSLDTPPATWPTTKEK